MRIFRLTSVISIQAIVQSEIVYRDYWLLDTQEHWQNARQKPSVEGERTILQVALCHEKRDFYEQNEPMRLESWLYPSNASMGTEKCVAPVFDSALEEQTLKNTWWLFIYLKKNSKKCWKETTVYILLWLIFILPSCSFLVCHVHSMLVNCSFSFEF